MVNCACCFSDFIAKCNTEISVFAQLQPLTSYRWVISDKFGKKYEGDFTTDSDGFWTIPVIDLPSGLLTEYSGAFYLEVMDSGCKPVKFKVAQEYDCIDFTVKGGTYEKNTLGCDFSCTPVAGDQNLLVPFEDEDVITIPWTSGLLASFGSSPSIQVYHLVSGSTYQLVDVAVQTIFTDDILTSIVITNSGEATGYVLIS
jgi:hypothetical protein